MISSKEIAWLSVNWDNEGPYFRDWLLGSHHAFQLVRKLIDNYREVVALEDEILDCPATNYHAPTYMWCVFHDSPKDTDPERWHDDRCRASVNSRECVFEEREGNLDMIGIAKANIGDQLLFIGSGDLLENPVRVRVIEPYDNFVGDLYVELENDLDTEKKFIKAGQTMGVMCSELRWPR